MEACQALCELDRSLMREFSDRTVCALERHRSIRLVMPIFLKIMAANVDKELDKDRMIIEVGSASCAEGATITEVDSTALFERTQSVDRAFIQKLTGLPVNLDLHYAQIKPIRIRRIEHLLSFVCQVCSDWQPNGGLMSTVQAIYSRAELHEVLTQLLRLYSLETRFVCESARLRGPARMAGQVVTDRVVKAMHSVLNDAAREIGNRLYRPSGAAEASCTGAAAVRRRASRRAPGTSGGR